MSKESFLKSTLFVINIIVAVYGLVATITGIWFYLQLKKIDWLRNLNNYHINDYYWHYVYLDFFIVSGVMINILVFCGWCAAKRQSRLLLRIYGGFMTVLILFQIVAAVLVFVYVDSEDTDKFIKDTVYDGFYYSSDSEDSSMFGWIESYLKCCGANDARDYRAFRNDFPLSCCDDGLNRGFCHFTDKEAIERVGCAKAAVAHVKIISFSVVSASLMMIILEITSVATLWRLFHLFREVNNIPEKKEVVTHLYEMPVYSSKNVYDVPQF